jgi:hypothetical protein
MNLVRRRVASAADGAARQNLFVFSRQHVSNQLVSTTNNVRCRKFSINNQVVEGKIEEEAPNLTSQRDDLISVLHRLDGALFSSSAANSDAIIADIRSLILILNI